MTVETHDLDATITKESIEANLDRIEGWEGLKTLAERIEVTKVEFAAPISGYSKWSVRGIVELALFNLDEESFGKITLQLMASGHDEGEQPVIDSVILSPEMR